MEILAHRGFWTSPSEKNQKSAFERAFLAGFGAETDLRDCNSQIVISHDLPTGAEIPLEKFLDLYSQHGKPGVLALNIKADGLQDQLVKTLDHYRIERYFLFDMSVPDMLRSLKAGLACFCRESEWEKQPLCLYSQAQGVWMDCFQEDWILPSHIEKHLSLGKKVCLVSPELHGRPHLAVWERYRSLSKTAGTALSICTDFPDKAQEFFQ